MNLVAKSLLLICLAMVSQNTFSQAHDHYPGRPPPEPPQASGVESPNQDSLGDSMTEMPGMKMGTSHHHMAGSAECSAMEVWNYASNMCMPLPKANMPMKMLMFHGNAFLSQSFEEGPRGTNAFTAPNMFMLDAGQSIGDRSYVNLEFMGTVERWSYPSGGYPEFLQIGELNANNQPYIDAQHPHSSPIMGLTLSDTISLGSKKDHLKIWFAPRGESTDGPIAFMHRPTGMVNPDAPLGHHIGQDVGHISSTVIGSSIRLSDTTLEISNFNGTEPEPTKVDLPVNSPNSYAARLIQEFNPHAYGMISAAFVKNPDVLEPTLDHLWRYSASIYNENHLANEWTLHNAFIWGLINNYDNTSALNSFAEEFWLHKEASNIWSRIEVLQRTPAELQVTSASPIDPKWVTAVTLGYTRKLAMWEYGDIGIGLSITKDFLPTDFQKSYGGNPLTGKIFFQVSEMKMWNL